MVQTGDGGGREWQIFQAHTSLRLVSEDVGTRTKASVQTGIVTGVPLQVPQQRSRWRAVSMVLGLQVSMMCDVRSQKACVSMVRGLLCVIEAGGPMLDAGVPMLEDRCWRTDAGGPMLEDRC